MLRKTNKVFDGSIVSLAWVSGVMLLVVMMLMVTEVVLRYAFTRSLLWIIDFNSLLALWIPFLAAAWVMREEGHVEMDFLLVRLKPRARALLTAVTSVVIAILFIVLVWYSTGDTIRYYISGLEHKQLVPMKTYLIVASVPIGSLFLFIELLRRFYRNLKVYRGIVVP